MPLKRGFGRAGVRRLRLIPHAVSSARLAAQLDRLRSHPRLTITYKGYALVYSRNTSLIDRIELDGEYEPEVTRTVAAELARSCTRTLLDVGANIGLISIGVLAEVPEARIFAFEPGRHQYELFRETIRRNGLEGTITLSPIALSDRAGTAQFSVHSTRHASGDGFVDTGRAGRSRAVTVQTETLDGWWEQNGRPPVDVIKIDTEGAELLVLLGAGGVLAECRPVVFLEIHPLNLRGYPYSSADVRAHLEGLGYGLETVFGETDFVARPKQ